MRTSYAEKENKAIKINVEMMSSGDSDGEVGVYLGVQVWPTHSLIAWIRKHLLGSHNKLIVIRLRNLCYLFPQSKTLNVIETLPST